MEHMLKNLYMVSQRDGVDIEKNLPQFSRIVQVGENGDRP